MIKVSGVLAPYGKPIKKALIKVTALSTSFALKNTYIRTSTDSKGEYSFDLGKGIYLIEYKQRDVMCTVGHVYVTHDTPEHLTLEELVRTYPAVEIPDSTSSSVDWEASLTSHESLASRLTDVNQAVKGCASSLDYEEASESIVGNRSRSLDTVKSKHSQIKDEKTSFSVEGNSLTSASSEIEASSSLKTSTKKVLEKTDSEKYSETNETIVNTLSEINKKQIEKKNNRLSYKKEKELSLGNYSEIVKDELIQKSDGISNKLESSVQSVEYGDYTLENKSINTVSEEYLNSSGTLVNKPRVLKETSTKVTHSINDPAYPVGTASIEDREETRVNLNGFTELEKSITLKGYLKTAFSRFFNDGINSVKEYFVDLFKVGDTFEVNNRTKVVKVKGKLEIENRDDFKGDAIFQVFQYSANGVDGWTYEFSTELHWRRHNTSINGVVNPLTWSKAYLLIAEDGHDGDTYYIEYAYSTDKMSWVSVFVDGHIWRKERIIENGIPITDWSIPARIRGADGVAGDTVYIEYQYSIDGLTRWHSNFSTGDHYRRERLVTNGIAGEWSSPAKVVPEKGEDYFDGYNSMVVSLYKRGKTAPAVPSKTLVYHFKSKELTGDLEGWERFVTDGTEPIYVTTAVASSTTDEDDITSDDWSAPVLLAQNGDTVYPEYQYSPDGINDWHNDFLPTDYFRRERTVVVTPTGVMIGDWSTGVRIRQDGYTPKKGVDYFDGTDGSFVSFVYRLSDSLPPTPTGGSFDGTVEIVPNGWTDDPTYSSTSKTWVSTTRYKKDDNSKWVHDSWSTPVQWLGTDGKDGVNTAQLNLYVRSVGTPPMPTKAMKYTFSSGELTNLTQGWSRTVPAGTDPVWIISAVALSLLATDIIEIGDWSSPVVLVSNGIDGEDGNHGSGSYTVFLNSSSSARTTDVQLDNDIQALSKRPAQSGDMITYQLRNPTANDTSFPRHYLRGVGNPSSSGFSVWEGFALVINGNALINGTVAGTAIKAKDITGDQISASARIIAGSGNTQAGMNGLDTDQWTGWRFWAGNSNPNLAPFRVDRTGKAWLDNVNVKGHVEAASGSLNNVVIGEDCDILGTLTAKQIVGDVTSSISKLKSPISVQTTGTSWVRSSLFDTVSIKNARDWNRTITIELNLKAEVVIGEPYAAGKARVVVVSSSGVTLYSQDIQIDIPDWNAYGYTSSDVSLSIQVPANATPAFSIYAECAKITRTRFIEIKATVRAKSTNNIWTALLMSDGVDLI